MDLKIFAGGLIKSPAEPNYTIQTASILTNNQGSEIN